MTILRSISLAVLAVTLVTSTASAQPVGDRLRDDPGFRLFAVFFGVTVDAASKLQGFRIVRITNPRTDSSSNVNLHIPQTFVAAARKRAERKRYTPKFKDGKPAEFYIFYYYSPEYPRVLISDLNKSFDDQP